MSDATLNLVFFIAALCECFLCYELGKIRGEMIEGAKMIGIVEGAKEAIKENIEKADDKIIRNTLLCELETVGKIADLYFLSE